MQKSSTKQEGEIQVHPDLKYQHRLCLHGGRPTEDITLEEFETCAIDRLYVLSEIESCYARNRPFEEFKKIIVKAQSVTVHEARPIGPNYAL